VIKVEVISVSWGNEVVRDEEGYELRVCRDVLRCMRGVCLGCGKCKGKNRLEWRGGVEVRNGVDIWFVVCDVVKVKLYNRISGRLRGLMRNSGRGWI